MTAQGSKTGHLNSARALRDQLREGIRDLPAPLLLVLDLHARQRRGFDEIGRVLGISPGEAEEIWRAAREAVAGRCDQIRRESENV